MSGSEFELEVEVFELWFVVDCCIEAVCWK